MIKSKVHLQSDLFSGLKKGVGDSDFVSKLTVYTFEQLSTKDTQASTQTDNKDLNRSNNGYLFKTPL